MSVVEREATESPVYAEGDCLVRPVTTADVLNRAADLLEEFGWCTGSGARDVRGARVWCGSRAVNSFCAAGAVTRAAIDLGYPTSVDPEFLQGHAFADYTLSDRLLNGGRGSTWFWNDQPGRTKEHVVSRLREAAARS